MKRRALRWKELDGIARAAWFVMVPALPSTQRAVLRDAIAQTLRSRTAKALDGPAVADATLTTWSQLAEHLARVIGKGGVRVLLVRSVHVASKEFPWLAVSKGFDDPLEDLRSNLAAHDAPVATAAAAELLTTLVGPTLSNHLLAPVWASPSTELNGEPS